MLGYNIVGSFSPSLAQLLLHTLLEIEYYMKSATVYEKYKRQENRIWTSVNWSLEFATSLNYLQLQVKSQYDKILHDTTEFWCAVYLHVWRH